MVLSRTVSEIPNDFSISVENRKFSHPRAFNAHTEGVPLGFVTAVVLKI